MAASDEEVQRAAAAGREQINEEFALRMERAVRQFRYCCLAFAAILAVAAIAVGALGAVPLAVGIGVASAMAVFCATKIYVRVSIGDRTWTSRDAKR